MYNLSDIQVIKKRCDGDYDVTLKLGDDFQRTVTLRKKYNDWQTSGREYNVMQNRLKDAIEELKLKFYNQYKNKK